MLVAALVATVIFLVGRGGSTNALAQIDANSAGAIDPGTNRLADEVHVGAGPGRIAAGFRSLWVVNDYDNTVSRIDPATGTRVDTIQVPSDPTAIAVGAGYVWVACTGTRTVYRIDPQSDQPTQPILVGYGSSGITVSPGFVWVTDRLDDRVTKIDSKKGIVLGTFYAGPSPSDIAYGFGALWIANESSSSVTRLNPHTGVPQEVSVGNGPEAVAIGYGSVWVANSLNGTISRINPGTNAVTAEIPVGPGPASLLASDGSIWVADGYGNRVVRVNPATRDIVRTITVRSAPQSLASIDGRVWLSARQTATVHRGGTLRLYAEDTPDSFDEGVGYTTTDWSVFATTGDGLVGLKRVGGLDGGTLVPDLATSLPEPTNNGRTYTFQLRPGIHYSNGDPVRASDLRRALERAFRIGPAPGLYFGALVGADACSKSRCDLSRGVVTNDNARTVTLRLRQADPAFLYKLAAPFGDLVPPEVSMTRPARLGVPGTGPYMIQNYKKSQLVLVRNPRFREWYAAAQPNGYPDRIVVTYRGTPDQQVASVEQGKSDLMQSPVPTTRLGLPATRLNELKTRYAGQVHIFPTAGIWALFLNTRLPPFDNLLARRAFNYAIDRSKAVADFGGTEQAAVTCQILPAGMTGYRPDCPYTLHKTSNALWTGPNLTRAKELVRASGTFGDKVVFWAPKRPIALPLGRLAVATLKRLGYRASLKIVARANTPPTAHKYYFLPIADSRTRAQAGTFGWLQDYPYPTDFFTPLFTCNAFQRANTNNSNVSEICNRPLDHAINHALTLQTTDTQAASNLAWAKVDQRVTRLAPWVPLLIPLDVVVVSRRVHNVQWNQQWGVLIDQIWVR